jgi:hypothetical protein
MFQCWENPAHVVGKRWFSDERVLKLRSKFKQILKLFKVDGRYVNDNFQGLSRDNKKK